MYDVQWFQMVRWERAAVEVGGVARSWQDSSERKSRISVFVLRNIFGKGQLNNVHKGVS